METQYDKKAPNRKRYWPMDRAGLYARIQSCTGTTDFPELAELVPEVLNKLTGEEQHWFRDRTRAAYNAGRNGQLPPERNKDAYVAEKVGPANFASFCQRVYELGKAERAKQPKSRSLDANLF